MQDEFLSPLLDLETWIKENYLELHSWKKVNKSNLAVERIINYHIYSNFKDKETGKNLISGVYASPVSSDTAFETKDAIINIDAKTVNFHTNPGDWDQLEIGPNQSSFIHDNCYPNEEASFSGRGVEPELVREDFKQLPGVLLRAVRAPVVLEQRDFEPLEEW